MAATTTLASVQGIEISTITSECPPYPGGVPSKFTPDGVVQPFPGNTTLCHVPIDSSIQPGLQAFSDALNEHPRFRGRLSILPPSSWHMTVLNGVTKEEHVHPSDKQKASREGLEDSTRKFSSSLQQLGQRLEEQGLAPPYRMKVRDLDALNGVGVGLAVEGATAEEEARIRRLRDQMADAMGERAPTHDAYMLHISIAYFLRVMDEEDLAELDKVFADHREALSHEINLGAVEFCTFENMYAFQRLFYLEKL